LIFRPAEFVSGTIRIKDFKNRIDGATITVNGNGSCYFNNPGKKNPTADVLAGVLKEHNILMKE